MVLPDVAFHRSWPPTGGWPQEDWSVAYTTDSRKFTGSCGPPIHVIGYVRTRRRIVGVVDRLEL